MQKGLSYRRKQDATPINHNVSKLFEQFLEARQRPCDPKPLRKKTVRSYRQAHEAFRPALIHANDECQLQDALHTLIGNKLEARKLSSAGMNVYIRGLNSFFSWCYDLGFLQTKIKIGLLPVERRKRPRTIGTPEITAWQGFTPATLSQRRVKHMGLLMLDTGIRAEECLALRESDIDWNGRRIWVNHGKGGANREVPLSEEGSRLLRRFLAETNQYRSNENATSAPIFCTVTGRQLAYRNALRDLKAVTNRFGTDWIAWHSFRRTFATQYIRNGGLLVDLQQILGHSDIRTTILYLGNEIDEIVAFHDQHSPLANPQRHRRKYRQPAHVRNMRTALKGDFRKRG